MRNFRSFLQETTTNDNSVDFIRFACAELGIENPPTIELIDDRSEAQKNRSFGGYYPSEKTIRVNTGGRHQVDVLRTLAHELVHHKQDLDDRIQPESGETGSDIENEANAVAGILMRKYGRANPNIFESVENQESRGSLHAFDVDGTLMHTTARVHVMNRKNERVATLDHGEFNRYKLHPGHHFDFSEFRSAHQFNKEQPIRPMLAKLKAIHNNTKSHPNSRVIINTARSDFDDKHKFAKAWNKYGVDIHHIRVERAGNIQTNNTVAEKKAMVMRKHLDSGRYREAHLYDDDHKNLDTFLDLQKEYPNIKFHAHLATPEGIAKPYKKG